MSQQSFVLKDLFPAPIWSMIWELDQDYFRKIMRDEVLPCVEVRVGCQHCSNSVSYGEGLFKLFMCIHCTSYTPALRCATHERVDEKHCTGCTGMCASCNAVCLYDDDDWCAGCNILYCKPCLAQYSGVCNDCNKVNTSLSLLTMDTESDSDDEVPLGLERMSLDEALRRMCEEELDQKDSANDNQETQPNRLQWRPF